MTTDLIVQDIYAVRDQFNAVLVDKHISFDKEANFAVQVLQGNQYALGIARTNRQSVIDAVTNIAAIGISLNPAKKQAYLVPRDGKICLDISYMGIMDLAVQSGAILWAQAAVVYQNDTFELSGYDTSPTHKFNPFSRERGEMVGVYVVVKTQSGDYLTHTMSVDEVNAIRDRSTAWKAWVSKKKSCPWVTDYAEMAKKTCVKQAYKYWPRGTDGDRLERAIHHLNTDGGEGLADMAKQPVVQEGEDYETFEALWLERLKEAATKGKVAYLLATKDVPMCANRDAFAAKHHKALLAMAKQADEEAVEAA